MAVHEQRVQRDLFTASGPPSRLPPEVGRALVALLEALLREVAGDETAGRGAGGEQDHA